MHGETQNERVFNDIYREFRQIGVEVSGHVDDMSVLDSIPEEYMMQYKHSVTSLTEELNRILCKANIKELVQENMKKDLQKKPNKMIRCSYPVNEKRKTGRGKNFDKSITDQLVYYYEMGYRTPADVASIMKEIRTKVNLTEGQIRTWFCNRNARHKK